MVLQKRTGGVVQEANFLYKPNGWVEIENKVTNGIYCIISRRTIETDEALEIEVRLKSKGFGRIGGAI